MSESIQLSTSSGDTWAALAMLYLQNQDLSGLTPSEILDKYDYAYDQIRLHHASVAKDHRCGWTQKNN